MAVPGFEKLPWQDIFLTRGHKHKAKLAMDSAMRKNKLSFVYGNYACIPL